MKKESLKKWTGKEGKEKHFRSFFGAITAANGSHLSQLDIRENLWLRRREGQAEVNEERVLRRGLWWGSDDTTSLQQWEVKGKNNMCLERGCNLTQQANTCTPPL